MTGSTVEQRERLDWTARLSDRLSPILVREVQQALSGRAFLGTLTVALGAVVILALVFAWYGDADTEGGREAFAACVACLAPIVLLVVPMQSFTSMRQEVSGGTAEQLLMTRLRPSRIVLGKVLAGFAQFVLFLGLFAPLMALTFLLRGVDVPTIALILAFAVLSSIAANTVAIALAAVPGSKVVQNALQSIATAVLMMSTFAAMAGSYELQREIGWLIHSSDLWLVASSMFGVYVLGIWLFAMVATASLAHAYENRSSPFRAFAAALLVLLGGWVWLNFDASSLSDAAGFSSATFALLSTPFWLWAVCEERRLSPRVRTLVPRGRTDAALASPFLPGGDRGVAFAWVLAGLGVGLGIGLPALLASRLHREATNACAMAWGYVVTYATLGGVIRGRLPSGRRFSWLAFLATLLLALVLALLPLIIELLVENRVSRWHLGHLSNPVFTIVDGARRGTDAVVPVLAMAAVAALIGVPRVARGAAEVLRAAADRRARAS